MNYRYKFPANQHSVKPGTVVVDSCGYRWVKIAHPNKWELQHYMTYRAAHGEIPKGMILTFRDGDKSNCSNPENIEAISRADMMRRNRLEARYPPAVSLLAHLVGVLTREVKAREIQHKGKRL